VKSDCGCRSHSGFLTSAGLAEVAQRELELAGFDGVDLSRYVDKVGSVSALVEVEDDFDYDEKHVELNARLLQMEML